MASTDKPGDPEYSTISTPAAPAGVDYSNFDIILRFLLFASSVAAVVVTVTANQTEFLPLPQGLTPWPAKFRYSPAFVYFVAAFSVSGLYSIITILASLYVIKKPTLKTKLLLYFIFWDALMLGITASATGTAGGVAYLGLKGNSHVIGWNKICNRYDKFCKHVGASIGVALFGSIVTLLLIWISASSIHSRVPK